MNCVQSTPGTALVRRAKKHSAIDWSTRDFVSWLADDRHENTCGRILSLPEHSMTEEGLIPALDLDLHIFACEQSLQL